MSIDGHFFPLCTASDYISKEAMDSQQTVHKSLPSPPGMFTASQGRDIESQKPGLRMCAQGSGFLHVCALDRCLPEI